MIDTHCHIDLYHNPEEILKECEKAGITVLAMTNLPSHFEMGYLHVLPFKNIRLALGMHPLYAKQHAKEFPAFIKNLSKTSYIGEVGLDFSREAYSTKELQLNTFNKVLDTVSGQNKILSLHSRRAEREVLNLLIEKKIKSAIFHWYTGPISLIEKISDAGYYFSINHAMIRSESGRKIISKIPIDKILTETDGPFIEIIGRQVKPSDIHFILEKIAIIKNMRYEELDIAIKRNFKQILYQIR